MEAFSIADTLWVFLAAILVFFMNLGFASVEAGFARAKNTVNILSKKFHCICSFLAGLSAARLGAYVRRR